MVTAVALFDKTGDLIFVGQSKGSITVVDASSLRFVDMIKVTAIMLCSLGTLHSAAACMRQVA